MLGKKNVFAVLLSSTLLANNTPSTNANYVYKEGTKENNKIELNYKEQIKIKNECIKKSLETSLKVVHSQEILKEHELEIQKVKQIEEQKKKDREEFFILTFYSSLNCENGYGAVTCQGKRLTDGMVANNVLSLGTRIKLEGYGDVVISDRGSSNFNTRNRLDVYVPRNDGESDEVYFKRVNNMGRVKVKGYIY